MIKLTDHLDINGYLEVWKVWKKGQKRGQREIVFEEKNLILTLGRAAVAVLLSGDDETPDQRTMGFMAWGSGGTLPDQPTNPIPPLPGDTQLVNELLRKPLGPSDHDFPVPTTVRFIATVEQNELNGTSISEAALFTKDGLIFARKTFGSLSKNEDFEFEFRWRIVL